MVIQELRLNEGDEYADIELGPLTMGAEPPQYLLTLLVPRRPPGDFPLVTTHLRIPDDGMGSLGSSNPRDPTRADFGPSMASSALRRSG